MASLIEKSCHPAILVERAWPEISLVALPIESGSSPFLRAAMSKTALWVLRTNFGVTVDFFDAGRAQIDRFTLISFRRYKRNRTWDFYRFRGKWDFFQLAFRLNPREAKLGAVRATFMKIA